MDWSSLTPTVVLASASVFIACCSFCVAIGSLSVAYINFQRSHNPRVRILETSGSFTTHVSRGSYYQFRIVIQNLGTPLHNTSMVLIFNPEPGLGWAFVPLNTGDGKSTREGQLAKGAITEFVLETDRMAAHHRGMCCSLEDLTAQNATLKLCADGYRMWEHRLRDRRGWVTRQWNGVAQRLKWRLRREHKTRRGTTAVSTPLDLTLTTPPGQHLCFVLDALRQKVPGSS